MQNQAVGKWEYLHLESLNLEKQNKNPAYAYDSREFREKMENLKKIKDILEDPRVILEIKNIRYSGK